jgi:hypothetical protein
MFEFKTAIHAIPTLQLYSYYFVLFMLYLFFLRGVKLTTLSLTIMLLFNQGFLLLIDDQGVPIKILFIILAFVLLFRGRFTFINRKEYRILIFSLLFMIMFFWNYLYSGVSVLWAGYQYYKYFMPIALYFGIKGLKLTIGQMDYYANLIIKLLRFQIVFSIVKLIIIGFRENIIGSVSNTGGNIGITMAVCGVIIYWLLKNKEFKGSDWWFVLGLVIIPIASNKRAIWLLYPIILVVLVTHFISRQTLRKLSYAVLLLPVILYIGLRLNPSFNPQKKVWGSFDPDFAVNFILSYTGVSQEKRESDLAQGRWGTAMAVISSVASRPLETNNLIGFPKARSGRLSYDSFDMEEYGLAYGTITSGIALMLLQHGWPATLFLLLVYINMISTIPDKRTRNILLFFMFWDTFMYSGTVLNTTFHSMLFVLTVAVAQYKSQYVSDSQEAENTEQVPVALHVAR